MAPAFGAVIATPERRALRPSASGEQHFNEREDRSRKAETPWARFTRAGPALPDAP
jgi:hypothetical protein